MTCNICPIYKLLSHHSLHPHELCHTLVDHVALTQSSAHTHTQLFSSPDSVPHLQYYFLAYLAFHKPHILHLKYNSSHILLCSNSNPALIHYVISPHVITLTSSLLLTWHPCSHQYCCALILLGVSALHYSTRSQDSEGVQTAASAHVLHQLTVVHLGISILSVWNFGS